MIRATTGGVMKTYRSNLMGSFIRMNSNRNTVLTQRTFNSYAEDPAVAARAFRLRKSRMTVESQYTICTDVLKKYDSAVACLQSIDDVLCTKEGVYGQYMKTLTGTTLSMLNDPTGDARTQLSQVLDQMSQSIIQTMNQKYGDNFIFAGADGHNVPFEIRDDGKLYYRGVPVDASVPNVLTKTAADGTENFIEVNANGQVEAGGGYYLKADNVKTISQDEYKSQQDWTTVYEGASGPIECNSDGSVYDPTDPEQQGGYYKSSVYATADDPKDGLISITEYDKIKDSLDNMKLMSEDDGTNNGTYQFVEVDVNGNPKDGGGYYRIVDESQLITKESYEQQKLDAEKLDYLAKEKYFVDIGYGFQEDPVTGKLIESSAFNAALNGITFLGYGLDEDGDPKNLYSLVQKMRDISDSVPEAGKWDSETYDKFYRLVQKFEDGVSNYQTEFVNLDASTSKLSMQQALLEDNFYNLQEQYSDLEDVDMVDAITSFIWAEYCYNAALKVGNSILGQSLMDYLS